MSQLLGSTEIEQILMIREYNNRVRIYFKVMMPFGECTNYSEQLTVEDLIITFGGV